jgi:hypothetical protein
VALGVLAIGALRTQGAPAQSVAPQAHGAHEPITLRGNPLTGTTGLRLVVADGRPFVLDVDTGSVTRLLGMGAANGGPLVVVAGVSERAAVVVADPLVSGSSGPRYARNAHLYAVRSAQSTVSYLGLGSIDVAPATSGQGVWTTRVMSKSHCQLRRIDLDGTASVQRAIACSATVSPAGALGLVANRTRIIDPLTGRIVFRTGQGVLAVAGRRVLLAGPGYADAPGYRFTLTDTATHTERRFGWPSAIGGLDEPAVDPRGRYIAIGFGDPAYQQGPEQVLDVWILDTRGAALTHLPGMPAYIHLKATSMEWTHDGRLVLLGQDDERTFVAVWRPGQQRLDVKTVQLPTGGNSGSDSFAIIR